MDGPSECCLEFDTSSHKITRPALRSVCVQTCADGQFNGTAVVGCPQPGIHVIQDVPITQAKIPPGQERAPVLWNRGLIGTLRRSRVRRCLNDPMTRSGCPKVCRHRRAVTS